MSSRSGGLGASRPPPSRSLPPSLAWHRWRPGGRRLEPPGAKGPRRHPEPGRPAGTPPIAAASNPWADKAAGKGAPRCPARRARLPSAARGPARGALAGAAARLAAAGSRTTRGSDAAAARRGPEAAWPGGGRVREREHLSYTDTSARECCQGRPPREAGPLYPPTPCAAPPRTPVSVSESARPAARARSLPPAAGGPPRADGTGPGGRSRRALTSPTTARTRCLSPQAGPPKPAAPAACGRC